MTSNRRLFSERLGFQPAPAEITIREDAPTTLREAVVVLAYSLGMDESAARDVVCGVLLSPHDPQNWSAENVANEVRHLVVGCPWPKVYDIGEALYQRLFDTNQDDGKDFERRLNDFFHEHGIGWVMQKGKLEARGSEAFSKAPKLTVTLLKQSDRTTASNELHEALRDISRRPADITGGIQHALAALECVARDVTGRPRDTLGSLIPKLDLPKPMDMAVEKLWGYASEMGRHVREGRQPEFAEAEMAVTVSAAVVAYLIRRETAAILQPRIQELPGMPSRLGH
jgi:hypothetical protein